MYTENSVIIAISEVDKIDFCSYAMVYSTDVCLDTKIENWKVKTEVLTLSVA